MYANARKIRRMRKARNESPAFNPRVREQLAEQRVLAFQEMSEEDKPQAWYMALWAMILAFFVRG